MLGIFGQVHKFVRIGPVVVKFLRSVLVGDQSPVTGSHRMVAKIGGCDGGMLSGLVWIIELRNQGNSFKTIIFGEFAQVNQGGVKIEQAGRFLAFLAPLDSRTSNKKGYSGRLFPQGTLGPVLFLTEVKPVIAPQNNNGIIRIRACLQSVQDNPHAMIDETNRGKVGMGQASLITTSRNLGMSRSHGIVIDGEKILREVVEAARRVRG